MYENIRKPVLAFGNDHAGVQLKKALMEHLAAQGYECIDYGAAEGEAVDYPVPGRAVAEAIVRGEADKGILICGTGVGISLAANKVRGIRAAACSDTFTARFSVQHNNCNILAIGARVVGEGLAKALADAFLSAQFEGGRHARRVGLIAQVEDFYMKDEEDV